MLAGPQRLHAHPGVVRNRAIDMDEVDIRIGEHLFVERVSLVDAEGIGDFVEPSFVPPAQGREVDVRMLLVDRNEFGAESEADNGGIEPTWLFSHIAILRVPRRANRNPTAAESASSRPLVGFAHDFHSSWHLLG